MTEWTNELINKLVNKWITLVRIVTKNKWNQILDSGEEEEEGCRQMQTS